MRLPARLLVVTLLAAGLIGCRSYPADRTPSLVGTWRLVSYTDSIEGEQPAHPFGPNPVGQFMFTPEHHASISIMRNPPDINTPTDDRDPDACIPGWYCAYFGTYEVDYRTNTWTVHVLGGNIPNYIGTDQRRNFILNGDRLIIRETYQEGGKTVHAERILARESRNRDAQ